MKLQVFGLSSLSSYGGRAFSNNEGNTPNEERTMSSEHSLDDHELNTTYDTSDTTRTKPTLVQRLESAIVDGKQSINSIDGLSNKKRQRDSENGDSNGSEKIKAIDKFRHMGIKELRE
ncbi:unnamed protein product [Ilex paraguariensis]|uniref:Uncharacterized protein n=1 Tax=Ilex paraguariensis TaxID=185542 RepID=A0ABC8SAN7_9AQUA